MDLKHMQITLIPQQTLFLGDIPYHNVIYAATVDGSKGFIKVEANDIKESTNNNDLPKTYSEVI